MASRIRRVFIYTLLALAGLAALNLAITNRPVASPTLAERRAALERVITWMNNNREVVLNDHNAALWWMVRTAADITRDARLQEMFPQALARAYPPGARHDLWLKFWQPQAQIEIALQDAQGLESYQDAMVSGLTCGATEQAWGTTPDWRERNQCEPWLLNVVGGGRWCATHQMMAIKLAKDMNCGEALPVRAGLDAEVQATIRRMLQVDPMVKDAYIQRVLMLWWTQGEQAVSPIWLRRVMDAQWADGGWIWESQFAGLPDALQPWKWRNILARVLPIEDYTAKSDFHPTAQGLLLMALAVQSAERAQGAPAAQGGQVGQAAQAASVQPATAQP